MAKKKGDPRGIRKLQKVAGHTITVSLPIHLVRELKWREHQKVVVTKRGSKLLIEDWKP